MQVKLLALYFCRTKKLSLALIFLTVYISLTSFYSMNGFVEGLKRKLYHSARNMSAGDIKVQTWQNWKDEWLVACDETFGDKYTQSNMVQFPTMLQGGDKSFLVSVKGVDSFYPFYGAVKITDGLFEGLQKGEAYIDQDASLRFLIKVGDVLSLGSVTVKIKGLIKELPDQGFSGMSAFSPTLLVDLQTAEESKLMQFGSRVSRAKIFKAKDPAMKQEWIEKDSNSLEKKLDSEFVKVSTWKDAQNMSRNLFERMSSYFNLLTYISVILSSVGLFLSLSSFVVKVQKEGALLHGLGVSKKTLRFVLFFVFAVLVFVGIFLGIASGYIIESYLLDSVEEVIVVTKLRELNLELIAMSLVFGFLSCGVIVYFSITRFVKKLSVFDYQSSFVEQQFSLFGFCVYIIFVFLLLGAYSWQQSASLKAALLLNGMIFILMLILFLFVHFILFILQLFSKSFDKNPEFFLASVEFFRNKKKHFPSLIALVLSSVLILGLIAARDSLTSKLSVNEQKDSANVFLIDIQKSQLLDVQQFIDQNEAYKNFNYSPLIRATLVHINDVATEDIKKESEKAGDLKKLRFLNRSYNLTYKDELNRSEKIVDGAFWSEGYDGDGISLEVDFARTMGLSLGDRVGFDLAGLIVEGKVTSIRSINWSSLLPNFFVAFPKLKLEHAPQFIIGSAFVLPENLPVFQNQLHVSFANVSVVDLANIFKKVQVLLEKVVRVISVSAFLCLMASFVILISALFNGEEEMGHKKFLMKSVGLHNQAIWRVFILEKCLYYFAVVASVFVLLFVWHIGLSRFLQEEVNFSVSSFCLFLILLAGVLSAPLIVHKIFITVKSRSL